MSSYLLRRPLIIFAAALIVVPCVIAQPMRHRIVSVMAPRADITQTADAFGASKGTRVDADARESAENRLKNAIVAWEAGDYLMALDTMNVLLRGPDSTGVWEDIALVTGEKWHTSLIREDARAPRWSPDSRWVAMEAGTGANRMTWVQLLRSPEGNRVGSSAPVALTGSDLQFSPDGTRAAYVTTASGTPTLVERSLRSGIERPLASDSLRVAQVAYSTDGTSLFIVGAQPGDTRARLYQGAADRPMSVLVSDDSTVADLRVVPGGRHLVFGLGGNSPLGTGTGTAFARGRPRTRFAVYDLISGRHTTFDGTAPVIAADGSALAYLVRRGAMNELYRLSLAPLGTPELLLSTPDALAAPAIAPDGKRVVFQRMPDFDWELFAVERAGAEPVRVTREIQHDLLPQFLDAHRVLAVVGEARHRRAIIHDLEAGTHTRLFHNNTIRTIAPEYEWVISPDATHVLVVAERDGDTVTPHRHLWSVDLTREVTLPELRDRLSRMRRAESQLQSEGARQFAPIAAEVRAAVAEVSTERVYAYEKALFDFDSKHITQPGNARARDYLLSQYQSFGLQAQLQAFDARVNVTREVIPTANVLAVLPGTESPELVYVVSSHFDSRAEGPGADDNTSGTAALLEAARVLSTRPQAATIIFASFTGEESGLLGSREFVRRAKADGMRLVGALNNDMLGWSNDQRLDNTIRYSNAGIRDLQHAAAFLFTRMITYDAFYYKSTDAAAFYDGYGDIVGGIGSYPVLGNPHYHQSHDKLEFENHQLIAEASKTTVASLMRLASSPSRLADVAVSRAADGAFVASWTPSPERNITAYVVQYGPPEAPDRHIIRVTAARAVLSNAAPGMQVAVKAINRRGLDGWDWARAVVR